MACYLHGKACPGAGCRHESMGDRGLEARKAAELDVEAILQWQQPRLALLFHQMLIRGWSRDLAVRMLKKQGWLL